VSGRPIPTHWSGPWNDHVEVTLSGMGEMQLDDLIGRTLQVAESLRARVANRFGSTTRCA